MALQRFLHLDVCGIVGEPTGIFVEHGIATRIELRKSAEAYTLFELFTDAATILGFPELQPPGIVVRDVDVDGDLTINVANMPKEEAKQKVKDAAEKEQDG